MVKALIVSGALALTTFTVIGYAASASGAGAAGVETMAAPPGAVVSFVEGQPNPVSTALVEEPVVVGQALSSHVILVPVPDNANYAYAIVNNQRVIVEPSSRKVVQIIP
ncbi:DUF1236 domain-containing protein [Rhizobium tumorigenes]|uniref:DUF1236 domain-containing protein n=1 Tax=Rhizobium tumorigenes TaxID=2041385 RepID=A0AAF1KFL2_9HYPH|nr:DUF1236 domain-containing protein [Rhizobium tumorigenes]WFR99121.1 DUF1236 domain-containing protein [Rhizobium tumorigenes]